MSTASLTVPFTLVLTIFLSVARAQQPSTKVGTINVQGAILATKEGQTASQALEQKVSSKQKEFADRQKAIDQLQDQLNKGGTVMAEDKRSQTARDIEEKKKRLERDIQDAEEDVRNEQQKLLQSMGQRMLVVIEKYAKDNGYTLVLDIGNPNTPVLFASTNLDITQAVAEIYNKTPAGAGKP